MKKIIVCLAIVLNLFITPLHAASSFVVRHIQFEGLQLISQETARSYIPLKEGQTLHPGQTGEIIRALYKTGFFDHISLAQSGNTLIIHVAERPVIGQLKIKGNSLIPTDKLTTVLKSVDIAEGRIYNKATLDRIQQSLLQQYYSLGRYNARVDIISQPMGQGRMRVLINISEGLAAKIRQINFIGNHVFSDKTLTDKVTISTPGILTFYTQTDQYSQERMQSSIEALHNYYLDRGYIKMVVRSSQVSITPDRKSVYVTFVIDEGDKYTIKGYSLDGDFVVPREKLVSLITIKPGQTFSRQDVINSEKAMGDALGDKGYVYSTVALNPKVDEVSKEVYLHFTVKPGRRMYVRHIYFSDNTKTNDEVYRREVQQMEASVVSSTRLEDSKRRINILPFVRDTDMTLVPVKGHDDQVDVNYKVTEDNAAEITGRIGYSQIEHVMLGAGINQKNFLGTGKTLGLNAQASRYERYYGFNYTDPYFTQNGISRSLSLSITRYDPKAANLTNSYQSNEYDFADVYSIPIGQELGVTNRFDIGYGYQNTLIRLPGNKSNISTLIQDFVQRHGRHFQQFDLVFGLSRDSRDRGIFPTRGARQAIGVNLFLPVQSKSLRYYMINYGGVWYHPLVDNFLVTARGALGYGNSFANGEDYPFFKNMYAGGIDSVRGYTGNTLGPRDNLNNPTGGNFLIDASVGLILPNFVSEDVRTTLFLDAGNVYQTYDNRTLGGTGSGPLRYSTGVQVEWQSKMGPITLSLARGLNGKHESYEPFQFSLGANFG